jgi:hypothetical protein
VHRNPNDSASRHTVGIGTKIGPFDVSAVDGKVYIEVGGTTVALTTGEADDVIFAIAEAIEATR